MHQSILTHWTILLLGAFLGSAINAIAGGGTLITFPLLIWSGLDPKIANATSTVALWPGFFGGMYGFRRDLSESSTILVRLGLVSVLGGLAGAWLLILTPAITFARLVPFLILFATLLFICQGHVTRQLGIKPVAATPHAFWWAGAVAFMFVSAIYGGYFGAGNSILVLAALGILGVNDLHRANGIKNFLGVTINVIAIVSFAWKQLISWPEAMVMAVGALGGGYFGAHVAVRLGQVFVRRAVIAIGLMIFIVTLWRFRP